MDDHPALRNTSHDKREAVLFLSQTSSGASGTSNGSFVFTAAHYDAPGYTIDTLDPAWLPAEAAGSSGASGNAGSATFITDSGAASKMAKETVSLADLKTKIAWVGGGKNVAGYDHCILSVVNYLSFYRDYEAHYGKSWVVPNSDASLASGAGAKTVVADYGEYRGDQGYGRFWLTGTDAALFNAPIVDNNTNASDGYHDRIETARPLPGGTYKFRSHGTLYNFIPCNFTPTAGTGQLDWTVTVTAPAGTVHEAFFDPVSITTIGIGGGGTTIGADIHSGALKPRAFTGAGGVSASLRSLGWQSGKVKLVVAPHNALTGYMLDFIGTDGKVTRSLNVANATVHAASNSLSWSVATAPWKAGDKLMLRIRPAPAATPTPTPVPKAKATPTPAPKPTPPAEEEGDADAESRVVVTGARPSTGSGRTARVCRGSPAFAGASSASAGTTEDAVRPSISLRANGPYDVGAPFDRLRANGGAYGAACAARSRRRAA